MYEDDLCLDVPRSKLKNPVEIQICHFMGGNQKWKYNNQVRTIDLQMQYLVKLRNNGCGLLKEGRYVILFNYVFDNGKVLPWSCTEIRNTKYTLIQ